MEITQEALLDHIANMSVLDLSELVKAFEEKFGVSATPAVAVGAIAPTAEATPAVEEQTEFDVVLEDAGAKKINVIKAVRELTGLGLKEAKELTESGGVIKESLEKDAANEALKKLEDAGAKVVLK
jgi:large subunit ribosomal protein L7/L12